MMDLVKAYVYQRKPFTSVTEIVRYKNIQGYDLINPIDVFYTEGYDEEIEHMLTSSGAPIVKGCRTVRLEVREKILIGDDVDEN